MIHLGDITKIDGYKVPIVDCVVGGSPCQDLSVAGLRNGLKGERSGLFMEQLRIIRRMTITEIKKEIERVQFALSRTQSEYLKRDYTKYLKRLQRELRGQSDGR